MTTLEFDCVVAAFIPTEERLKASHFSIGGSSSPFTTSNSCPWICSTLETIGWMRTVPLDLVTEFTENCPIRGTHVHLDINTESIADVLNIGPSSTRITDAFFTYATCLISQNLEEIALQFPNIKHLTLTLRVTTVVSRA